MALSPREVVTDPKTVTDLERQNTANNMAASDILTDTSVTAAQGTVAAEEEADPTQFNVADATPVQTDKATAQAAVSADGINANTMETALVGAPATSQAAQGTAATSQVQGQELVSTQLQELLKPGEDGGPPAFAQPAVAAVEQMLAERGISRSSIAGADLTNAIIQSAIPLASQNAAALQRRSEINLSNNQQMQVQNLSNRQQSSMANAQFHQQQMLTDASALNASRQFNASSKNQTDQFMSNLSSNIKMQNASRIDAMDQFNSSASNAMTQFNEQQAFTRQSFNSQNATAIQQSNLQWRRQLSSANTVNQQQANMTNAQNAFAGKSSALAFTWQEARDTADHQWKSIENNFDRVLNYETTIKSTEITAKAGIEKSRIAALSNAEAANIAALATTEATETEGYASLIGAIIGGISNNWE